MRLFALIALVLSLSACSSPEPVFAPDRCACSTGVCVQQVGTPSPAALSCEAASSSGCAGLSSSGRRCWGSPTTAGLCLCADAPPPVKMAAR